MIKGKKGKRSVISGRCISAAICAAAMAAQTLPALAADTSEYATREYTVSEFVQSIGRRNLTGSNYILSTFEDADEIDEEYKSDLSKAVTEGLLRGYDDKRLEPKGNIKRIEALVILSRVMDLNEERNSSETSNEKVTKDPIEFTDVPQWAKDDVDKLSSEGIVEGYGNGVLGADDYITEEQVKILTDRTDELFNTTDVGDSYYGYVNNKLFRNAELTSETTVDTKHGVIVSSSEAWSYFDDVYNDISDKEDELLEKLMAGELTYEQGSAEQRIHDMLLCLAASQKVSDDDKALITEMRNSIIGAATVEDLIAVTREIQSKIGIEPLLLITSGLDKTENYACPTISFNVWTSAGYMEFNSAAKKAGDSEYKKLIKNYLTAIGSEFSDEDIATAVQLQYTAAKNTNKMFDYESGWKTRMTMDPEFTYESLDEEEERLLAEHPDIDPETLEFEESKIKESAADENLYNKVDAVSILGEIGYNNFYKILYYDGLETEEVNSIFAEKNLDALKIIALVSMGMNFDCDLSDEESTAINELCDFSEVISMFAEGDDLESLSSLYNEFVESAEEEEEQTEILNDDNISTISDMLPNDIGLMYCDYYYDDSTSDEIVEMIQEIWDAYIERFDNNRWMSETTKENAKKKIDNMVAIVGYPDNYSFPTILSPDEGGTYVSNLIRIEKNNVDQGIKICANREFIREMMLDSPDTVNACYYQELNNITIFAGILDCLNLYPEKSGAWNLGVIGAVIGHEIGHAFDKDGSQYDERGRKINWWTDEDKETYDGLVQHFIDYYSNFEVMDGVVQDSSLTIGENMADFAGMVAVMDVIGDDKEAQREALEGYATTRAQLGTEKYITDDYFMTDEHSANSVRVNAVVASLDCFYDLYDIEEGDAMYVAPEDRLKLW